MLAARRGPGVKAGRVAMKFLERQTGHAPIPYSQMRRESLSFAP